MDFRLKRKKHYFPYIGSDGNCPAVWDTQKSGFPWWIKGRLSVQLWKVRHKRTCVAKFRSGKKKQSNFGALGNRKPTTTVRTDPRRAGHVGAGLISVLFCWWRIVVVKTRRKLTFPRLMALTERIRICLSPRLHVVHQQRRQFEINSMRGL